VATQAGEHGARPLLLEGAARQHGGRLDRLHAEAGHHQRMSRGAKRAQQGAEQGVGVLDERRHHPGIGAGIAPELAGGGLDRSLDDDGRPVIERMGEGGIGLDQLQAEAAKRK